MRPIFMVHVEVMVLRNSINWQAPASEGRHAPLGLPNVIRHVKTRHFFVSAPRG